MTPLMGAVFLAIMIFALVYTIRSLVHKSNYQPDSQPSKDPEEFSGEDPIEVNPEFSAPVFTPEISPVFTPTEDKVRQCDCVDGNSEGCYADCPRASVTSFGRPFTEQEKLQFDAAMEVLDEKMQDLDSKMVALDTQMQELDDSVLEMSLDVLESTSENLDEVSAQQDLYEVTEEIANLIEREEAQNSSKSPEPWVDEEDDVHVPTDTAKQESKPTGEVHKTHKKFHKKKAK